MSICVPNFIKISQYLDPQHFEKAWQNSIYVMTHTWKTTLLWTVNAQGENTPKRPLSFEKWLCENMEKTLPHVEWTPKKKKWVQQPMHSPTHECMTDENRAVSTHHCKPPTVATPRGREREFESGVWLPLKVKCTSHEYEGKKMTLS
jgi:hypothetical protein